MRKIVGIVSLAALMAGCSSNPESPTLALAENEVAEMRAMQGVENAAASHVDSADFQLRKAQRLQDAGRKPDQVEHHALLAMKHAQIAQERLKLQTIKQQIQTADDRRQAILLDSSRQDALTAERKARLASLQAAQATEAANAAKAELERIRAEARDMASELKDLKARQSERGTVLTLSDIVFETDSANILPGALRDIDRLASFLKSHPDRAIRIEGSTDSRGTSEYNRLLSEKRANAVKSVLVDAGVSAQRITTAGLGEEFPVASNDTAAGQQKNRRVEIIVANEADTMVPERQPEG